MAFGSGQALALGRNPDSDKAEDAGDDREPTPLQFGPANRTLLVDVRQAAHLLQCSRSLLYELLRSGELPTVKVGRLTRIPVVALNAFVTRGGFRDPTAPPPREGARGRPRARRGLASEREAF